MNLIESFLPEIEEAYLELHTWLTSLPDTPDYRKKNIYDKTKEESFLSEPTMRSAAAQYYVLFPAHFFKVSHILNKIIDSDTLANSPRICLVDVGCGAGAASAAFISCLLKLR